MFGRLAATAQLVVFALLPPEGREPITPEREASGKAASQGKAAQSGMAAGGGECLVCAPGRIRGGFGRLLNERGDLELCFPGCLAIAAPALLFRLKREGFSDCTVEASERGLLVRGRR